jgi:hypothetical protein
MLRREIYKEMSGFDEKMIWNEDDDLWFRIMLRYKVSCSDYVSGLCRKHESKDIFQGNMSRDRHKMTYYQYLGFLKYFETEKNFVAKNIGMVEKRVTDLWNGYIKPKKSSFRFRIPRLANIQLYLKLLFKINQINCQKYLLKMRFKRITNRLNILKTHSWI